MADDLDELQLRMLRSKRLQLLWRRTEAEIEDATMKRDELRKRREEAAKSPAEKALEESIDRMLNPESPKVLQQETAGGTKSTEDLVKGGIDALNRLELKQKVDKLESEGKVSEARELIQLYKEKDSLKLNKNPVMEIGKEQLNPYTRTVVEFWEFMNKLAIQQNIANMNNPGAFAMGGGVMGVPWQSESIVTLKITLKLDEKGRPIRDEKGRFVPEKVSPVLFPAAESGGPGVVIRHTPASKFERFLYSCSTLDGRIDYGKLESLGIWNMRTIGNSGTGKKAPAGRPTTTTPSPKVQQSNRTARFKAFRTLPGPLKDRYMVSVLPSIPNLPRVKRIISRPLGPDGKPAYHPSGEPKMFWMAVLSSNNEQDAARAMVVIKKELGMEVEVWTSTEGARRGYGDSPAEEK